MKVSYRISTVTAGLILACTLVLDGIGFLLTLTLVGSIVAAFIGAVAAFVLWLTFALHGVKYTGAAGMRRLAVMLVTAVGEIIPIVGALPLTTVGAAIIIVQTRAEDKVESAKKAKEQEALARQRMAQMKAMQQAQAAANDNQQFSLEAA